MNRQLFRKFRVMHVMRNFILVCAFLLSGFAFLAAQDVFDHPLSAATLPRFNAVCAELSAHPLIKGAFEQTKTITRLGRSLNSKGNFIIASELGMVWDTLSPFPSTMAVGRDFIIQTGQGGTKSKLDARGNETFISLADTISAIFSGNAHILNEKFDNYFLENREAATWTVGLIPRDNAVRVFAQKIVLVGTRNPALIQTIVIYSQNGDRIQYSLSGQHFPAALNADEKALFSF